MLINTFIDEMGIKMRIVPKNDPLLTWLGRWADEDGKFSGWGGSSLQFKFTGTSLSLEINVNGDGVISSIIDDFSKDWTHTVSISKKGKSIVNITTNLENKEHIAFLRFASKNYKAKWDGHDYIKITNILIDDDAHLIKHEGTIKIGYYGDSWAAAGNDITRFLGLKDADVHSISESGYTSYKCLKHFPYAVGKTKIKDEKFDVIVLGYGENDSSSKFLKHKLIFRIVYRLLIYKIRKSNPKAHIFLVQSPRNFENENDFSMFGDIIENIARKHENFTFISSNPIEQKLTWQPDKGHLDIKGKHVYGKWIGSNIKRYLSM
jgi:hypothetical protein